ncbi:MAG TPA: hypothetical protein VIG68_00910 [Lysobacter sp.]
MPIARAFKTAAGYLSAIYLALVLFLVLYGALAPQAQDLAALRRHGLAGPTLLVGLSDRVTETPGVIRYEERRYYAVLPDSLSQHTLWVAVHEDHGPPRIGRSGGAFWLVFASLLASLAGFWWYWIRAPRVPEH